MSGGLSSFADALAQEQQPQDTYGTATYLRTDSDGTAWVRLVGSDIDTPANGGTTVDAKEGDTVTVRQSGTRLYVTGNGTTPAVGQQQVVDIVSPVERMAEAAGAYAQSALESANTAAAAAESAVADATIARGKAEEATAAASTASTAAKSALLGLSTVEDVVDTLTWITKHGTMTLTTDTTVDPSKVYFVPDASGQYVVGGSTYSIVQNPTTEGLSGYYELTIDKSVENYIATHVSVTNEGLWLTPTSSNGYRVLIATGAGTTYTTAGTYIIDNSGNIRAIIGETITLGSTGESHAIIDYHSLQLVDKDGNPYFHVSDLRDKDGNITERFDNVESLGNHLFLVVNFDIDALVSVTVDSVDVTEAAEFDHDFVDVPCEEGVHDVVVVYSQKQSQQQYPKAYTLGVRTSGHQLGAMSAVLGYSNIANGRCSYAEGWVTASNGEASHAEGFDTKASADYSHAQNRGTIAASVAQTAIGKYNEADTNGNYALIIGNGTDFSSRSNALTVGWDGNIVAQAMAGIIQMFAGAVTQTVTSGVATVTGAPAGWLLCDGSAVSRTEYATLFAAIGTTWGSGDGSTTFNLPDLRGRAPIGSGTGSGLTSRSLGTQNIGEEAHTLSVSEMPAHSHAPQDDKGGFLVMSMGSSIISGAETTNGFASGGTGGFWGNTNKARKGRTGPDGGGGSHNNMQPSAVVNFIICTGMTS